MITTPTPPISNKSFATYFPPGLKFAIYGVFLKISATSNKLNFIPASWAIAGKCKAAFVEPPVAATIAAAFSNAFKVTISLGYGPPFLINSTTASPDAFAYSSLLS